MDIKEALEEEFVLTEKEEEEISATANWTRIIIAIDDTGIATYLTELENPGYKFKEYLEQMDGIHNLNTESLPKEAGVYECHIHCESWQDYSGDYDSSERVVSSTLLFKIP